ncbi:MAG: glycosyltransferase [Acidimicrobiales bacterium]
MLVVGMHRSGTSVTASALGGLGLRLPHKRDLAGPSFGNERGQFESQSLMALSDELLGRLGRSWDDPPELEEMRAAVPTALEPYLARAGATFEAAFEAPSAPVVWKDPRTALLLPFWRAVLDRPLAAVLATRDPLEIASSLERRDALPPTTSVALWERYCRAAVAGLEGLPVFVSVYSDAVSRPREWTRELAAWLARLEVPCPTMAADESLALFDPAMWHERRTDAGRPGPAGQKRAHRSAVLAGQDAIFETLVSIAGPHESFAPVDLGDESPWTTAQLRARHDLNCALSGAEWLARQLSLLAVPTEVAAPHPQLAYPMDATDDEVGYHAWLQGRGEPANIGSSRGLMAPATRAPTGHKPVFSVVVPAYRSQPWAIERCVSSVLSQDFASWELVIVDDASADPVLTAQLAKVAGLDDRVLVISRTDNGGISAATNDGISRARGEYVVFLDHDDELAAGALRRLADVTEASPQAELLYSDEDKIDEAGRRFMPALKPGWSPDLLLSNAYMCHLLVVRRRLVNDLGGLRSEFDGAQDYDLMLRATEQLSSRQIIHVPEILYHWRTILGSASGDPTAKPWAFEAGRRALEDALVRRGITGDVISHPRVPGSYHVRRRVSGRPLVSAIVPFRDEPALLAACYRAFVEDPGHDCFELLLVDNDSVLPETMAVKAELRRDRRVRFLDAPGAFDWVAINNRAVEAAEGELLLFMNNDVEAKSPSWLAHMVAQAQREDVGAVGARLLYPDGTVQHGGVAVGVCLGAAHLQQGIDAHRPGYLSSLVVTRNCSAVTGACMMSRRAAFESVAGFDTSLPVAFNDIDYCLRLREKDLLVVYAPLAELVHHESKSRGHTDDAAELPYFRSRWRDVLLTGDPYYNPNLGRFDSFCRLPHEEDEKQWENFRSMLNMSSTS